MHKSCPMSYLHGGLWYCSAGVVRVEGVGLQERFRIEGTDFMLRVCSVAE